jgi:inorganic pyrophosphatase
MITMKIEIPVGSNVKYEIDKVTGELRVDRLSKLTYPATYGYIKDTLAEDGDQLDVFLLGSDVYIPGSIIDVDILGMLEMSDNGIVDNKVIAKVHCDNLGVAQDYLDRHVRVIKTFLRNYKENTIVGNYVDKSDTVEYYEKCKEVYEKK